jgi:GxxExxY protein
MVMKQENPKDSSNSVKPFKMEYEDITHKIIGAAYNVYNQLGFGFLESVYHKAMLIELSKYDLKVESEKPLNVFYDDQVVGDFNADLFVENTVVVELKSRQNIAKGHEVQLVNYLNCLRKEIGLLINFGPSGVDVKRKYRDPVTDKEIPPQAD